jgi:DNA-binding transcriptional ArsR family regulator
MSRAGRKRGDSSRRQMRGWRGRAPAFAALGDATRLALVARLSSGEVRSIAELTAGSKLTRQAITKHLRVLEQAGIVHGVRAGRESLFEFDPQPMEEIKSYIDLLRAVGSIALQTKSIRRALRPGTIRDPPSGLPRPTAQPFKRHSPAA